ncbi:MAG: hypothetical protein QGF53_15780 [Alphaproteobacteria bacterium]|nr:hypothetical protein [Alphaproteobacteria bacterium]
MRLLCLGLLAMLAACANAEDERLARWQERCAKYGFEAGTAEMASCVQTEEQNYRAADAEERECLLED